ncbi:MAG: helix-turn-helix domain-containing protein [Clostridiales bacterium]|nr:helix-turn-helix domain-containing protein [Clostridiales bacterium]MDO4350186.1 helix-turn-helix transcriptional regulator [Eubacteriales bacterium]MDY4008304.1 helix-turn-helix transcriptional regulator [Candidatus Limiplasma sp.]
MQAVPMYQRIRAYIEGRGLERTQVAAGAGVTETELALMLQGKRRITTADYERLCRAMRVRPDAFYRNE